MSRRVTSRLFRASIVLPALTLPAPHAVADPPAQPGAALRDAVAVAAPDLQLMVAIDNARASKGTPLGAAVAGIAQQILAQGRAEKAWAEFAQSLGWTTEQAFDELFGTRVMLVVRGLREPEPQWALLGDVSAATERRLRERLGVAPRNLVRGHAVMAVERGEYELTSERAGDRAVLLFAPAKQPSLLDDLLPLLGRQGDAGLLGNRPNPPGPDRLAPPRVVLTFRAPDDPRNTVGIVGEASATAFRARVVAEGPQAECSAIPPFPLTAEAAWRRLVTDETLCALAIVQGPPGAPRADPSLAMWVQGRILELGSGREDLAGRNCALVLRRGVEAVFSIAAAVELTDVRAAAAAGDAKMGRLLIGLGVEGQDFGGIAPEAERRASLGAASLGAMRAIQGPTVRWSFPSDLPEPGARGAHSGWWVVGSEGAAYGDLRESLTLSPAHGANLAVSRGLIRPAAILEAVGGFNLPLPRVAGALARIEAIEWTMRREGDERMGGEMVVRVVAPPGPAGGGDLGVPAPDPAVASEPR